jgi:hypothetical protein
MFFEKMAQCPPKITQNVHIPFHGFPNVIHGFFSEIVGRSFYLWPICSQWPRCQRADGKFSLKKEIDCAPTSSDGSVVGLSAN